MTKRRKLVLWLALGLSLPGAAYGSLGFVYFVWLEQVQQWGAGRAELLALVSLAFAVLCAGTSIYCVVSLLRNRHGEDPAGQGAT